MQGSDTQAEKPPTPPREIGICLRVPRSADLQVGMCRADLKVSATAVSRASSRDESGSKLPHSKTIYQLP